MSGKSQVIGQGTYGCVLRPSLECGDKNISYDNKASKVLSKGDAKKEIKEYVRIEKADPRDELYLGTPTECDLKNDPDTRDAVSKCNIGPSVLRNLSGYKLIVMENGGENLETYSKKVREWPSTPENKKKCELFLLESLRLFYGVLVFKQHNLIHHDLKPQNIVYNEETGRLNFIDFGIMQDKKKLKKLLLKGKTYTYAQFHWSYPWETEFLYKGKFDTMQPYSAESLPRQYASKTGNYVHLQHCFYYSLDRFAPMDNYNDLVNERFAQYREFILSESKKMPYEFFAEQCLNTIDVYGLGIALAFWFHSAKAHLDVLTKNSLNLLLSAMLTENVAARLEIEPLLEAYEKFITDSGLLEKYDKVIENHIVINKADAGKVKPVVKITIKKKPIADPAFANADPGACPEGKERNPKTNRCVNVCKDGEERDANFKCKKTRKVKEPKEAVVNIKNCLGDKELNPNTNRCVKKCKEGQERNKDFKCVSNKTLKNKK
jgi:serine/threonine protein kinase